ncbi:DUF4373 domain-containing protein [Claveliimonas bilis]|uniref:DUF4373 domain-containing protein n=1 Tax=Claveliimonas bilis TaxID=3028070 RepID=UPI001E2DC2A0|nr:DUF4373 domain-containing protein [Claveliimonas bilis]
MIILARFRKDGLNYFPLDVNFFYNEKIKILDARYGKDGVMLYLFLLGRIYDKGYYIHVNEDFEYLVSAELKMGADKVKQVLTFLLSRSLFDNTLFQSDAVLTSAGIQKRWQIAKKEAARKTPIEVGRFWLLKREETEPYIKCTFFDDCSGKNDNNSGKKEDNSGGKTIKESKVNNNIYIPFQPEELEQAFQTYLLVYSHNHGELLPEQIQILREELISLSSDAAERLAIVRKATTRGWKGFYPIRKQANEPKNKKDSFNNFKGRDYSGQMDDLTKALIEGGK